MPDRIFRDFLITGHPRSGTGFAAHLFSQFGYDVRHEEMGMHGTSSWMLAVRTAKYPFGYDGLVRDNVVFGKIIHIIREPLACIASIYYTEHGSEEFRSRYVNILGNPYERAVLSYCGWNRLIFSQNPDNIFPTEYLQQCISEMLNEYRSLPEPHQQERINAREHPAITERDLIRAVSDSVFYEYQKIKAFYEGTAAQFK